MEGELLGKALLLGEIQYNKLLWKKKLNSINMYMYLYSKPVLLLNMRKTVFDTI